MASHPTIPDHPSRSRSAGTSHHPVASTIKAFVIGIMGVCSVLLFAVSLERKSVLGLWLGFICALISGFFVQCLINSRKAER